MSNSGSQSTQRPRSGQRRVLPQRTLQAPRGWRLVLGLATGLSSSTLAWAAWAGSSDIASSACGDPSGANPSALCCHGEPIQQTLPGVSVNFLTDVCQLLMLPTATRAEADNFVNQVVPGSVLSHTSASPDGMTLPSLWWTRDSLPPQVGRRRLVDAWISYTLRESGVRVVDVMVNPQFWRALTMAERYGVLNKFGTAAQDFDYQMRFFQTNGYSARLLGLYACMGFEGSVALQTPEATRPGHCLASVDATQIAQLQQAIASYQPAEIPAIAEQSAPAETTNTSRASLP